MNPLLALAYRIAGAGATLATRLAPRGEGKVVRAVRERRGGIERFVRWGAEKRDVRRPLVWMHAPSVGEGLQARPVLERLRARRPDVQLVYTFYSPSAERFARGLDVDFTDYLPFDTNRAARQLLDALRPSVLCYAKLDVWPLLTLEAARRTVRLGLVSAALAPGSSRRRGLARALLHDAYAALDTVGAVSPDDAERLIALGVRRDVVHITGDTRYDQVATRAALVDRASPVLAALSSTRPTLVAGSTWPADEAVLLPAWEALRRERPDARLIIAPHEPTADHLLPIERWAAARGIILQRLGAAGSESAEVVLVDRTGILGDLYALATAAFVGGGFHAAGLHSVLEPAAFGVPVAFGPRFHDARDAMLLAEAGGGASTPDATALTSRLSAWLARTEPWRTAGDAARTLVAHSLGAADRSVALLERWLPPTPNARGPS